MRSSTHRAIACIFVFSVALVAHAQTTPVKESTATISGQVTIKGKGAPGVVVALRQAQSMSGREFSGPKAVTDLDGNYRITNLAPGTYRILPAARAYIATEESGRERVLIVNKGDTIEHIDFALVRGAVITGKVVDPDGNPIVEQWLEVLSVPDNKAVYVAMTPLTDDRGVFRIYGLRPGSYRISAAPGDDSAQTGLPRLYSRTYYPSVNDPAQATIVEVSEGGETKDIDITLTRTTTTPFAASGRVIDAETGQPIANVSYGITRYDNEQNSSSRNWGAATNSRGEFKVENLTAGKFLISVSAPDSNLNFDELRFEILDQDVSGLVIKARPAASISGVVVFDGIDDKTAREQFPNIYASASIEGTRSGGFSAKVGEDGSFHLKGLAAGTVNVYVYANGSLRVDRIERDGVIQPRGIVLTEREQIKGVRVVVQIGNASVRGKIEITNGTMPADGRLFVWAKRVGDATNMFSGSEGRPQLDQRGQFVIEGLAAGTYEIEAGVYLLSTRAVGYMTKKPVVVTAGSTTNMNITMDLSSTAIKP